jgi:hypothetical protein
LSISSLLAVAAVDMGTMAAAVAVLVVSEPEQD